MKNKKESKQSTADKHESNYIDKIIKENCKSLMPVIIRRIFKLEIDRMQNLPAIRQQVTLEKEPDFLRMIFNKDYPKGAVAQLEFETGDTNYLVKRMLIYLSLLHNTTGKPVLQYVLYLGKGKAKMSTRIKFGGIDYHFTLINIEDFSYKDFINGPSHEEVILSILANHDGISFDELMDLILARFVELRDDDVSTKKFINQLIMFSRYRNLHEIVIKKVENMSAIAFDVNTDILYVRGKQEGIELGVERGEIKKAIFNIVKMTPAKFDKIIIAEFSDSAISFVEKIQKQLLKKDEIIALLKADNMEMDAIAKKLKVHPLLVEVVKDELTKPKK